MRRSAAPALRLVEDDAGAPEGDYLDLAFRPGDGLLAAARPGYERRDGQVRLARAVDLAFRRGGTLLAEAETGIGKSYAALVPATYHAATHGKRVAYVTSSIVLQEQVVRRDLPALQAALPWSFTHALAKGINNYLCLAAVDDVEADRAMGQLRLEREDAAQLTQALAWAKTTATGDLSDLPTELRPQVRLRVTTTSEECAGKACERFEACHHALARAAYARAQVVVTNYHLFFADVAVRRMSGGEATILPDFDLVVLDEGDRAPAIASEFFGWRLTAGSVRHAARLLSGSPWSRVPLPSVDPGLRQEVGDLAERYFDRLLRHRRSGAYRARLRRAGEAPDSADLRGALARAAAALAKASESDGLEGAARARLRSGAVRCRAAVASLEVADRLDDPKVVVYVDEDRDRAALVARLVSAAEVLAEELYDGRRAVVVMSATMAVGGSFSHARRTHGLEDLPAAELRAESPFDHRRNALLVVPPMPEPSDPRYPDAMAAAVVDAVRRSRGRALCLFTSYKNLAVAHAALLAARLPYRVMRQKDAPRTQLVEQFKADESSVLLGTESFWTGVDVPGPALSLLVVDKLPFPPPDDPVLSALEERMGSRVFNEHSVPQAVTRLRQACGRLIRCITDRGVIVILDSRLRTKGYGVKFLRSLPPMRMGNLDEIDAFI